MKKKHLTTFFTGTLATFLVVSPLNSNFASAAETKDGSKKAFEYADTVGATKSISVESEALEALEYSEPTDYSTFSIPNNGSAFSYVDSYKRSNFIKNNTPAAILAGISAVVPKYIAWVPAGLSVYCAGGATVWIKIDRYYDKSKLEWAYNYTYYSKSNYTGYISSQFVEQYPGN